MKDPKIKLILNALLIILILFMTSTGIYMSLYHGGELFGARLSHIHQWLGYIFALIVIIHLILNYQIISNQISKCLGNKNIRLASIAVFLFLAGFIFIYPLIGTSKGRSREANSHYYSNESRINDYHYNQGNKHSRMFHGNDFRGYRHSK